MLEEPARHEQVTHFGVLAFEMLFDDPPACPVYPPLRLLGVATDLDGRRHLVVDTPTARAYLGPDSATVSTRAEILARALRRGGACPHPDVVRFWLQECWEALLDELVDITEDGR